MHGCHRLRLDLEGMPTLCLDAPRRLCCFRVVSVVSSGDEGPLYPKNSSNTFPACGVRKK
jgi:hypothetical protein